MHPSSSDLAYVTSAEEVLWGIVLIAITMVMHGFGMLLVLRGGAAWKLRLGSTPSFASGILVLILASWMIFLVHLSEAMVWAAFFLWKGAFPTHSLCMYYALNEYTTVGSPFNLPLRWRLLEGMIATAGLLSFAWSASVLLTLVGEFQARQLELLSQRRERRQPQAALSTLPSGPSPGVDAKPDS